MENNRSQWSSNFGFLMAAIGSAVGLGNLWGFPYKMGANGGFPFLIIYLIMVILCGVVIVLCEMAIGRRTGKSPALAMAEFGKRYKFIGIFGILSAFIIMGFYSLLGGYTIEYCLAYIGDIFGASWGIAGLDGATYFGNVVSQPWLGLAFHAIFIIIAILIVRGGVEKGIEKFNKIAMPALAIMLVIVIIRGLTLPGSSEGLKFMFKADFSAISTPSKFFNVVRTAGTQMLFSLSLGMGAIMTYGSYLNKKESLVRNAWIIPIADTVMALLSGLAIFPAVFALNIDPASGVGLMYQTLVNVFNGMGPIGPFFGAIFYFLVFIAAITSVISLLEVVSAHLIDSRIAKGKPANRKSIVSLVGLAVIIIGIPVAFDQLGGGGLPQPLGLVWVDFYDFLSEGVMMPLGAALISLLVGWKWGKSGIWEDEISQCGNKFTGKKFFLFCAKFITPLLMIFVLITTALSFFGI